MSAREKHDWLRAIMRASLAAGAAKVAWCLADHAANGVAWPLVKTMAAEVALDEKNVRTHLRSLRVGGWLLVEDRRHLHQENWYWLAVDGNPIGDTGANPRPPRTRGVMVDSTGQRRPVETTPAVPTRPGSSALSSDGAVEDSTGQQRPLDDRAAAPCRAEFRPGEIAPSDRAAAPGREGVAPSSGERSVNGVARVHEGTRAHVRESTTTIASHAEATPRLAPADPETETARRQRVLWTWWSKRYLDHRGIDPADRHGTEKRELVRMLGANADRIGSTFEDLTAEILDGYWAEEWPRRRESKPTLRNLLDQVDRLLSALDGAGPSPDAPDPPDWHPATHGEPRSARNERTWQEWLLAGCPQDPTWTPPRATNEAHA